MCGDVRFDAVPAWDAARHVLAFALTPANPAWRSLSSLPPQLVPQTITSTSETGPQKAQPGGLWSRLRDKFTK